MYIKRERDVISFTQMLGAKGYSIKTIGTYVRVLEKFLNHISTDPRKQTSDDIVKYLCTIESSSSRRQYVGTLKNFYTHVIGQPNKFDRVPYPKKERRLPRIISAAEVRKRLSSIDNLKHRTMMSLIYVGGLRRQEVIEMKVSDVDLERKTIFIQQSKGAKDRTVIISDDMVSLLVDYFAKYAPDEFLFYGWGGRYSASSVSKICNKHMGCSPHSLRHYNATHLLEDGVPIEEVSKRLGHRSLKTTMIYNHVRSDNSGKALSL